MDTTELQRRIVKTQRLNGELSPLFDMLYEARDWLVDTYLRISGDRPLLGLRQGRGPRGAYLSQGPFGFGTYIELNPLAFGTGADMCETLVHELAHWFVDQIYGIDQNDMHDAAWQRVMLAKFDIAAGDKGEHEAYGPGWHDIHAHFLAIGLGDVLLS